MDLTDATKLAREITRGNARALDRLVRERLLPTRERPRHPTRFRCNVTGAVLRLPCRLTGCRYHVDYEWSCNCLLAYMHEQGCQTLSVDEIAFLYRRDPAEVKATLNQGMGRLRAGALEQQRDHDDQLERSFRYLLGPDICCVCESGVDEPVGRSLQVESLDAVYCSRECRDAKPPRVIELEFEWGVCIETILTWTFRRYRSLALAEQALGMPRWLVYESARRYLDSPIDHYFPALKQVQVQRRNALIRRTWHAPGWVEAVTARIQPVVEQVGRWSPVQIDLGGLRARLAHVLESL